MTAERTQNKVGRPGYQWTEENLELLRAADPHSSRRELRQRFRCPVRSLSKAMRAVGLRLSNGRRRIDWKRARDLAEQGISMTQAAEELRCHHTSLVHIAKVCGFQWRRAPYRGFRERVTEHRPPMPIGLEDLPFDSMPVQCALVDRIMELQRKVRRRA